MANTQALGELINWVDVRNKGVISDNLLGINIDKFFMPSVANIIGTDLSYYKLIRKKQFACNPMHVGRDEKMPIALYMDDSLSIVSPAYFVFEIKDAAKVNPEYLMLWFRRAEFDRECWYHTDGSVRGGITWDEILEMTVPVPSIEEQNELVKSYRDLERRIQIKKEINDNLEEQIKTIFIEKIIHNSDFDKWEMRSIAQLANVVDNRGKTPPHYKTETDFPLIEIGAIHSSGRVIDYDYVEKYVSEECYNTCFRSGHPHNFDTLMSTVGSLAELKLFIGDKGSIAQNLVAFHCLDSKYALYLYQYLLFKRNDLLSYEIGSVQASIKVSQVIHYSIKIPTDSLIDKFNAVAKPLSMKIYQNSVEILSLQKMKKLILSALSR